jgi:hypothetical protein
MVAVTRQDGMIVFEVEGLHKLWAVKDKIKVNPENILDVHQQFAGINGWRGWRIPGTHIPYVITAGTYFKRGEKHFWDVMNWDNTIVVELKNEDYTKLIIEVHSASAVIKMLKNNELVKL